ncbi:lantibiotic dehydratase [Nonomuraea indica]|uniref:Lantibiotic dehydratase n=1 Tax=Nonomuraea indica TaxID=1581193 RepID=A0ABW8A660_9ACTN
MAGLPAGGLEELRFSRTWELVDELLEQEAEPEDGLADLLAAELAGKIETLRRLAGDDAFLRGLACCGPALSARLESWLAAPDAVPKLPALARLARQVARAAATTSPHAAFVISGLGRWSDDGPAEAPAGRLRWKTVAEIELGTVWRVWEALSRRPGLREAVEVRVNPSLWQEDGWLWFLGAGEREPLTRLPAEPTLAGVFAWLRGTTAPTVGALEQAVAVPGLVERLLEIGVLERRRPFADQSLDPLADLAAWVEEVLPGDSPDRPWLPTALREAVQATYGERIRHVAGWLLARLGDKAGLGDRTSGAMPGTGGPAGVGARPGLGGPAGVGGRARPGDPVGVGGRARPGDPVGVGGRARLADASVRLETAVSPEPPVVCGGAAWRPVLRDLDTVRRLVAVFDPDLLGKLAAAEHFLERYGAGASVPFLRFYRDAPVPLTEPRTPLHRGPGPGGTPDGPAARRLAGLRRETWDALYGGPVDGRGVVTADPDVVDKLAASWPAFVRPAGSITCYGHLTPGPEFVLNAVTTGYGRGTGRTRYLLARAGLTGGEAGTVAVAGIAAGVAAGLVAGIEAGVGTGGGAEGGGRWPVAECLGSFGDHLNLRPAAATPVDYPFTVTDRPGPALTELRVSYDPDTQRLALHDADGAPVLPVHLGMTGERALPPAWSFLVRVFGEPPVAMPSPWGLGGTSADVVLARPRLRVGSVVLARAGWRTVAAELPIPADGESDAGFVLRTARWLRRHGVPRRFFARFGTAGPGGERRPMYVDVENHFLLLSLARAAARREGHVVLEEALPDPADSPAYGSHGRRVTEYVLEVPHPAHA